MAGKLDGVERACVGLEYVCAFWVSVDSLYHVNTVVSGSVCRFLSIVQFYWIALSYIRLLLRFVVWCLGFELCQVKLCLSMFEFL